VGFSIKHAKYLAKQQQLRGGSMTAHAFYRRLVVRVSVALQFKVAEAIRTLDIKCQEAAALQAI
jgi:hypothetical protein